MYSWCDNYEREVVMASGEEGASWLFSASATGFSGYSRALEFTATVAWLPPPELEMIQIEVSSSSSLGSSVPSFPYKKRQSSFWVSTTFFLATWKYRIFMMTVNLEALSSLQVPKIIPHFLVFFSRNYTDIFNEILKWPEARLISDRETRHLPSYWWAWAFQTWRQFG